MSDLSEKIKAAEDVKSELVTVPQWDVKIEVRTMSGFKRAELLQSCLTDDNDFDQDKWQGGLIIETAHDPETGEKVFTQEDAEWLMQKSSAPLELLAATATRINGLAPGALKDAENL